MPAAGPLVRQITRSESNSASSTSWVTITVVTPASWQICISCCCRLPRVRASSAPKGSSSSSSFGSIARARAIATRCFMPPESSAGSLSAAWARPTRLMLRSTRSRRSASLASRITVFTARAMFWRTVCQGSSE